MAHTEFDFALESEPIASALPFPLPLAHLTAKRWLLRILKAQRLEPRPCKILLSNLLYFSYGGVFYRNSKIQTERVSELPVALLFSPEILRKVSRFYPFDSGAMGRGLFGPEWTAKLAPFDERFRVNASDGLRDATKLIHHLYDTNQNYLNGRAHAGSRSKMAPFPLLYDFLSANLSTLGVDHRQRTIEAICEAEIEIAKNILWIGFPAHRTASVLKALLPCVGLNIPPFRTYNFTKNFNPAEIAARLEEQAYKDVVERFVQYPT